MSTITTIIADDEPKARRGVKRMLREYKEFQIVHTCSDGKETLNAIRELKPDLVFLDIQMPGYNGFELLEKLDSSQKNLPEIVFITAYDEFALQAFDVHAIDYLMKPFDTKRFEMALGKVKKNLQAESQEHDDQSLKDLLTTIRKYQAGVEKIMIKEDGKFFLLDPPEIHWIEASGNYVEIVTSDKKYLVRDTMKNTQCKLDSNIFFRIHRSTIVNIKKIKVIEPWFRGDYKVIMSDGTEFNMSRKYKRLMEAF